MTSCAYNTQFGSNTLRQQLMVEYSINSFNNRLDNIIDSTDIENIEINNIKYKLNELWSDVNKDTTLSVYDKNIIIAKIKKLFSELIMLNNITIAT